MEVGLELVDGDGLMVNAFVFVLVVEGAQAVAAYEAVEFAEFVVADEVEGDLVGVALPQARSLHQ